MALIEIRDFDEVTTHLQAEPLLAEPLRTAYQKIDDILLKDVEQRRPTDQFKAIAPFQTEVDPSTVPAYALVSVDNKKEFRVAQALNFAADTYHYRSGPYAGRSTRSWFTGALPRQQRAIEKVLDDTARDVEKHWSSS